MSEVNKESINVLIEDFKERLKGEFNTDNVKAECSEVYSHEYWCQLVESDLCIENMWVFIITYEVDDIPFIHTLHLMEDAIKDSGFQKLHSERLIYKAKHYMYDLARELYKKYR